MNEICLLMCHPDGLANLHRFMRHYVQYIDALLNEYYKITVFTNIIRYNVMVILM